MKTLLGGFLASALALSAIACGAPGDTSVATTSADTTTAFDPDFEAFTTRADAEAFIAKHVDDIFGVLPVAATDPRTVRAQALLDKHWPAVVAKYHPNFPEPFVFVVNDDATVNAQAMFDYNTDEALNIIYVYSGILAFSDSDLEATLLHETGHLTTKNGISRYADALVKDYRVGPAETVGIAVPNDPEVQAILAPYFSDVYQVAGGDAPELGGLASDPSAMAFFLEQYTAAHQDATSPDCTTFASKLQAAKAAVAAATSPFDGAVTFDPATSVAFTELLTSTKAAAQTCLLPPANVDLETVADQIFQAAPGSLARLFGPDEAALWAGKDAISGLFALANDLQAKERAFRTAPGFTQYREYSDEEQADDFAMTVMYAEGTDLGELKTLFMHFITDPTWLASCNDALASGTTPPYNLSEPHHGSCYRAFHVDGFRHYLDAGGVGVVIPNIPRPAVQAEAAIRTSPLSAPRRHNSTL